MSDRRVMWIIMSTVVLLIVAVTVMGHAHAKPSCLDRAQATRVWPTKQIAIDGDGCYTYMRRGLRPASEPAPEPAPEPETPPIVVTMPDVDLDAVKLDMLERWPVVVDIPPKARVVEVEPLMSMRSVATVILAVILFCAVIEVAFGGVIARKWSNSGPI